MKTLLGLLGLTLVPVLLTSCSNDTLNSFTIVGEFIAVGDDKQKKLESGVQENLDPTTATVSVTFETTNDDGEPETVVLANGKFVEHELQFKGDIEEPTLVDISVDFSESLKFKEPALLLPGITIRFALVDFLSPYQSDQLALVGRSIQSTNNSKKFSISGDFSGVGEDLTYGIAEAWYWQFDEESKQIAVYLGTVMLENGTFKIEADIDEPKNVTVSVQAGSNYYASTNLIIEPNIDIEVTNRGLAEQLIATSGTGLHTTLIESWQQSEEYLVTLDAYTAAYAEYLVQLHTGQETPNDSNNLTIDDTINSDSDLKESNTGDELSTASINEKDQSSVDSDLELAVSKTPDVSPAKGCEHLLRPKVQTVNKKSSNVVEKHEVFKLEQRLKDIRASTLQNIAQRSENPFESLLALELGAFGSDVENKSDALIIYDKLVTLLDEETVTRRVVPAREKLAWALESENNDKKLQPGQRAPKFTLANLEGQNIALYDVLEKEELVLLDFWASDCGWCIVEIPELVELYTTYNPQGFEIVSVSTDIAFENWKEASMEHELPWVDLGEMDGWEGETATTYGVKSLPKGYLLDSKGCIIERDIRPKRLEEILVAHYGEIREASDEGN